MPAIRYRRRTDEQILDAIDSLVSQKESGHAEVDFGGHMLKFNSPSHIEAMIVDLEREIASREAVASGKTKKRSWLFTPALPGGKGYL